MDNQQVVELIQAIGLPTALSVYLLFSNNKHIEKYELLLDRITEEMRKLNDTIRDNSQVK